jgi:hypothetical protein
MVVVAAVAVAVIVVARRTAVPVDSADPAA